MNFQNESDGNRSKKGSFFFLWTKYFVSFFYFLIIISSKRNASHSIFSLPRHSAHCLTTTSHRDAWQSVLKIREEIIQKAPADCYDRHRRALFYLCTSKRRRRGPGGDRTLVQTGKSYAFYTLISAIVFEQRWVQSNSYATLSSKFSPRLRGQSQLFPICLHHYARELRKKSFGVMSRPLTPWTDKALMYYTSIKQREHNCFRQLNCWRPILKCPPSGALRAYAPPRPAVKSGRARNMRCKGRHWARGSQLLLVLFYFDLLPVISLFQPKMRPQQQKKREKSKLKRKMYLQNICIIKNISTFTSENHTSRPYRTQEATQKLCA